MKLVVHKLFSKINFLGGWIANFLKLGTWQNTRRQEIKIRNTFSTLYFFVLFSARNRQFLSRRKSEKFWTFASAAKYIYSRLNFSHASIFLRVKFVKVLGWRTFRPHEKVQTQTFKLHLPTTISDFRFLSRWKLSWLNKLLSATIFSLTKTFSILTFFYETQTSEFKNFLVVAKSSWKSFVGKWSLKVWVWTFCQAESFRRQKFCRLPREINSWVKVCDDKKFCEKCQGSENTKRRE